MWKQNLENASSKISHSRKENSRMKIVYPDSLTTENAQEDPKEVKAVDNFRQALISNNLLPEFLDDYHMMLR